MLTPQWVSAQNPSEPSHEDGALLDAYSDRADRHERGAAFRIDRARMRAAVTAQIERVTCENPINCPRATREIKEPRQ
jgi:hypothetical protein